MITKNTKLNRTLIGNLGFTLIELLIVMSIIGVLAGVSLFALRGARASARDGRRKSDLETIRSGLELYKADCNNYPAGDGDITDGAVLGTSLTGGDGGCGNPNVYIQTIPNDVLSGRYYRYFSAGPTYELCASLEEGSGSKNCGASSSCGSTCNYKVINP